MLFIAEMQLRNVAKFVYKHASESPFFTSSYNLHTPASKTFLKHILKTQAFFELHVTLEVPQKSFSAVL